MESNRGGEGVRGGRFAPRGRGGFRGRGGAVPIQPARGGVRRNEVRQSNRLAKKYQEKAHLGALIVTNKSRALQRLMRDYNELKEHAVQYSGVTAHPLDDNFFEWHGNLKATAPNLFKGAVMHIKIVFSNSYPITPPKIYCLNPDVEHPSIAPSRLICVHILDPKKESFKGWTSAYSVLSILLQLQNFFFDIEETYFEEKDKKLITSQVRAMNDYNCLTCKHKGSSNPWPEFVKNDQDLNQYIMTQDKYLESIKKELVCFHTKIPFDETPLGIGINIVRIPRTGEIKGIIPCLDLISLKAYSKERIRRSMSGERFTHWFPLYFGSKPEQFLHLAKKAISMICTGSTKNFTPDMVLKVIPKFFNITADIMSEKVNASCKTLRILIYIYRAAIELIRQFPVIRDEIEAFIFKFLNDPASRHKDHTPSLGDLLAVVALAQNVKIEDLLPAYIDEQMDRQVFWIISALPEFENLINSSTVDDIRAKVCFKAGIVGNQILLFYYYLNKKIFFKPEKSIDDISKRLDSTFGNLSNDEIYNHHKEVQNILAIESYRDYYKYLSLPVPDDKQLNTKLKDSYKNSALKGYHGKDEVRFVPDHNTQIKLYFQKFPSITELSEDNGRLRDANDPIWEKLCLEKFDNINRLTYLMGAVKLTPYEVVKYNEETKYEYLFLPGTHVFEEKGFIKKEFNMEKSKDNEARKYLAHLNWRQVYVKLYLEIFVKYFRYIADFQYLYNLLDLVKDEIIHFNLIMYQVDTLKSDYNYLRVILSKLTKLKQLNLIFNDKCTIKTIKNLLKGVNNFNTNGGDLHNLTIFAVPGVGHYSHKDFNMLTIIDKLPNLKVLDLTNTALDINSALRIRNHLYYFKTLEVLNLSNCKLGDEMAKEIADGIMKAKSLEKIYLDKNELVKGLANILYNLAFQPSLKLIDISENNKADVKETSVALYKLIKMSQSLNTLICRSIPNLLNNLTSEFFYSLGDNSSLSYLDISLCGTLSDSYTKYLGQAVAFNALKKGALNTLLLRGIDITYPKFCEFINSLEVSESLHFTWYGTLFNSNILKDSKEYYEKKFNCSLVNLDLGSNSLTTLININDLKIQNVNHFRLMLERCNTLRNISFAKSTLNRNFIDMIANALLYKNTLRMLNLERTGINGDMFKHFAVSFGTKEAKNPHMNLELLDISNNKFGYAGIEVLSDILKTNKTLRVLNLFHNLFDVNGARRLRDALTVNGTVELLDIGYNRIKDLGFSNIVEGILFNKESKVTFLGCKYNFVKSATLLKLLPKLLNETKIQRVELGNNSFDTKTLDQAFNLIKGSRPLNIDLFETLYFLTPERLERTVWVSPINYGESKKAIYNGVLEAEALTIEKDKSHVGVPLFLSQKRGRKLGQKKTSATVDAFIEFIHPNSANRLLKIAATNGFYVSGKKMRVYKAGTKPERLLVKQKKIK
jgi:ubiquitin-protein ligase/Ran GTPase-activating protein (RanGAP) involved in mRNA processing and transport